MKRTIFLLTLIMALAVVAQNGMAAGGNFGLGVIIGEPTGPCFKYWTGPKTAIDGAAAWSFAENAGLHLHADYLIHKFDLIRVEKGSLPLYFGIGGRVRFAEGSGDDRIGIRIPVGLDYIFATTPLDIFLEIVPILDLAPDTDLDFNGALGVRFFF
jgi:hypothetical protein